VATLGACSSVDNHLLFGQQYEPTGACLDPAQAIDDIDGSDPGSCAPACLLATEEGGVVAFITTTCGPYPPYLTQEPADAAASGAGGLCKGAFAAYAAGAVCGADGGGPTRDGGVDGGPDGAVDATSDAHGGADAGAEGASDAPAGG